MEEKKKIVLIEHDATLRDMVARKMESVGYRVETVSNGVVAIEKIRAEKPVLVVADLLTPRKSAIEILEEFSPDPDLKDIPFVVIASANQSGEIARAKELGVREFLIKEIFNPEEIIEKVNRALNGAYQVPAPETTHGGEGRTDSNTPPPSKEQSSVNRGSEGAFVLVVEDDKFLRELLVRKLLAEKFLVENAIDAEATFAILKERKPNIILLDLILPGVSGFDILARLKADQNTADIPVIILSNLGQKEDIDRAKSLGAQDFMVKANFTLDEIVEKVHTVVG